MQIIPIAEQIFGHNKAPLDEVLATDFKALNAEVEALAVKISKRPAKVKDETDFAAAGAISNEVRAMVKRLETTRKAETDPLLAAQKGIKAHFDVMAERIEKALKPHTDAANSYVTEKDAREKRERAEAARRAREQEDAERLKAEGAKRSDTAARAEGRAEALAAQADKLESSAPSAADTVRTRIAGGGVATAKTGWDFAIEDYDAIDLNKLRPYLNRDHVETAIRSAVRVNKGSTAILGVRVFEGVKAAFR